MHKVMLYVYASCLCSRRHPKPAANIAGISAWCCVCVGGGSTSKDSVKAALGQKTTAGWDMSEHALQVPSAEARVQFWTQPGLQDPTLQERLQHAWAAVLGPTGKDKPILCMQTFTQQHNNLAPAILRIGMLSQNSNVVTMLVIFAYKPNLACCC